MTEISFLPFYSADATTKLARALFTNAKVSFILFLFSQAKRLLPQTETAESGKV